LTGERPEFAATRSINIGANTAILDTVHARQVSLRDEQDQLTHLTALQQSQLTRRIDALKSELAQLDREIATQEARVESSASQYSRYKELANLRFLSDVGLQQKHDELLAQVGRHQGLRRNRMELARELAATRDELDLLPTKSRREKNQLARSIFELEQIGISAEAERQTIVAAPQAGTVTSIAAEPGQTVFNQPLLTLLPTNARLVAHLYVQSRAMGFIRLGQKVSIRYAAFPYQKFGQYSGTIVELSRSALSVQELPVQLTGNPAFAANDGLYRVQVKLASQTANVYGKPQALMPGMALEADVMQETRTIIEWILEPLYSLKGTVL
jgi:membrane fusion protein